MIMGKTRPLGTLWMRTDRVKKSKAEQAAKVLDEI